ncbi:hypothetical protein FF1_034673 [Malus domestica]
MSLSNDDDRKVFGIVFRTPPIDSTGVANILQQSVLCGSRKNPVKKPFDELVRGSFSTSLHAKTMADRTYYSGSCTTTKELYNMVDVHLDAVFFPKCLEDVQIFQQQGVVFNQRKEFYSRPLPEDILKLTAQQASFPSTLSSNRLLFIFSLADESHLASVPVSVSIVFLTISSCP